MSDMLVVERRGIVEITVKASDLELKTFPQDFCKFVVVHDDGRAATFEFQASINSSGKAVLLSKAYKPGKLSKWTRTIGKWVTERLP